MLEKNVIALCCLEAAAATCVGILLPPSLGSIAYYPVLIISLHPGDGVKMYVLEGPGIREHKTT